MLILFNKIYIKEIKGLPAKANNIHKYFFTNNY